MKEITIYAKDNDTMGNRSLMAYLDQHFIELLTLCRFKFVIVDGRNLHAVVARGITSVPGLHDGKAHVGFPAIEVYFNNLIKSTKPKITETKLIKPVEPEKEEDDDRDSMSKSIERANQYAKDRQEMFTKKEMKNSRPLNQQHSSQFNPIQPTPPSQIKPIQPTPPSHLNQPVPKKTSDIVAAVESGNADDMMLARMLEESE